MNELWCGFFITILTGLSPSSLHQKVPNYDIKEMTVPEINYTGETDIKKVPELLEAQASLHSIDLINWKEYPYRPEVHFRIGHANEQIWIVFNVREDHVLALRTATNSPTHKDSCVEFFIDPKQDGNYYNFEFNAIGTTHLGYGPDRGERKFIDPDKIESLIQTRSSLGSEPFEERNGEQEWQLTVIIPAEIFMHSQPLSLSGLKARANFYKCGDDTTRPHFLTWNPVGAPRPDYHQPDYFGKLVFE